MNINRKLLELQQQNEFLNDQVQRLQTINRVSKPTVSSSRDVLLHSGEFPV